MRNTATLDFIELSDMEKTFVCTIINVFGSGQHPVADNQSINGFTVSYLKTIMNSERFMVATAKLSKDERSLINIIYTKLKIINE